MVKSSFACLLFSGIRHSQGFGAEDDAVSLLQTRTRALAGGPDYSAEYAFNNCATFGSAEQILGTPGDWRSTDDMTICRCFGDTHCDMLPFDFDTERAQNIGHRVYHYQYQGGGASRYAKASDDSWEVQIYQCFDNPGRQQGAAIRVGRTVVEVWTNGLKCFVNGVAQEQGAEVHLPNGFHYKCPTDKQMSFCATLDGQFLTSVNGWDWEGMVNQVLAVPQSVDVQIENTVCYDPSSKNGAETRWGKTITETAVVPPEEVIFSQAGIDYIRGFGCPQVPQGGRDNPPNPDPKSICDREHPEAWAQVQQTCEPLKAHHEAFYTDCLMDECLNFNAEEEQDIEEIAQEGDEFLGGGDEAAAVADPHLTNSNGKKFDIEEKHLNHHH